MHPFPAAAALLVCGAAVPTAGGAGGAAAVPVPVPAAVFPAGEWPALDLPPRVAAVPEFLRVADGNPPPEFDAFPLKGDGLEASSDAAERLADLLDRVDTLERERDRGALAEDLADDGEAEGATVPTLEIGGRIHLDHWGYFDDSRGIDFIAHPNPADPRFGTDPENQFAFRRVRLEMKGDILEPVLYRVQVEFNNFNSPTAKDVYVGFDELPGNNLLLVGHQKRPLGLDALNSSKFNVFLERPFAADAFNEGVRRLGIALYGYADGETYGWQAGAFLLGDVARDGRVVGDDAQPSLNGRFFTSPIYQDEGRIYLHLAAAGTAAFPDGDAGGSVTNANEARFRARPEARTVNRWLDTGRIAGADFFNTGGLRTDRQPRPAANHRRILPQRDRAGRGRRRAGPAVPRRLRVRRLPTHRRTHPLLPHHRHHRPFGSFQRRDLCRP